jgi:hypothetical protein
MSPTSKLLSPDGYCYFPEALSSYLDLEREMDGHCRGRRGAASSLVTMDK